MMKRSAYECVERYNTLVLQGISGQTDADEEEYSVQPAEALPALQNGDKLDEDELEMLAEARARMANTQGKKSQRKFRERLLEDKRRASEIARHRALRARGLKAPLKQNTSRFSIDYNADVPFEVLPAEGVWSTTDEKLQNARASQEFMAKAATGIALESKSEKDYTKIAAKHAELVSGSSKSDHIPRPPMLPPVKNKQTTDRVPRALSDEELYVARKRIRLKFAQLPEPEHLEVHPDIPDLVLETPEPESPALPQEDLVGLVEAEIEKPTCVPEERMELARTLIGEPDFDIDDGRGSVPKVVDVPPTLKVAIEAHFSLLARYAFLKEENNKLNALIAGREAACTLLHDIAASERASLEKSMTRFRDF